MSPAWDRDLIDQAWWEGRPDHPDLYVEDDGCLTCGRPGDDHQPDCPYNPWPPRKEPRP
jgi:hypothetical protein